TKYAAKYVPRGARIASPEEIESSRIARELKIPTARAIEIAAEAMASLVDGPCWLIRVPASNMSHTANLVLARAIAERLPGSRVKCAICRTRRVESSYLRRQRGLFGLSIHDHAITRVAGPMEPLPAYFVDNVITSGTTIAA